ncbi:MAG: NAD(P)H-binding protein [Bryobacterales bacterium]|nr:NAD(P)H-binding protein [Bryobacterales bacterium]
MQRTAFVTGGTGYLGSRLIPRLREQGWDVCALVRPGSEGKLPPGCRTAVGNALDAQTYKHYVNPGDTLVHLVGVPHPSPAKARQFEEIDYRSAVEAMAAARERRAAHFVYVSVAHPAPVMTAYWRVRERCEGLLRDSGVPATVLRPWYVIGPGHWWPLALKPVYAAAERLARTREAARRLGLVTIDQMVDALTAAVCSPPEAAWRVWTVPEIREARPQGEFVVS